MKTLAQKILLILSLLIIMTMLTACHAAKSGGEELALDIRAGLLKASNISLTADVTADHGDRVYQFTFTFSGNADKGALDITAPENVAGLHVDVSVAAGTIKYDGAELNTGTLTDDGLSPAKTVPILLSQWQSGYISGTNYEKLGDIEALAVTTDVSETVKQRTWFDAKTHLPLRSELSDNGRMVIACVFQGVSIE